MLQRSKTLKVELTSSDAPIKVAPITPIWLLPMAIGRVTKVELRDGSVARQKGSDVLCSLGTYPVHR